MSELLNKYGRFVSSLFVGKGKETRLRILEALFFKKMTRGELTTILFKEQFNRAPTYREKQKYGSTIFRRTKELLEYGYIERKAYRKIKGNDIPVFGLTNKGFLCVTLLSLKARNNLWKFLEAYTDEAKKKSSLIVLQEARKYGVSNETINKLLISFEIEPFKRLIMSGEINLDIISNEKLSILTDEIIMTSFSEIMENIMEDIAKGKPPKLPSSLSSLSPKERKILLKIFKSPKLKERRKEEIVRLEKYYKQKLSNFRKFKNELVEGNTKKLAHKIKKFRKLKN